MFKELSFKTDKHVQVIDLTPELGNLELNGNGLLHVFTPHATAALTLNEAEHGLMNDFEKWVADNFKGDWHHDQIDDNASAHLASGLIGSSATIPVKDGRIIRGAWQNLLFFELDGPRNKRRVIIQFLTGVE
ncbi:YjbQ family protein [archaeon]|nr:YjbQ family protein [archaeon]